MSLMNPNPRITYRTEMHQGSEILVMQVPEVFEMEEFSSIMALGAERAKNRHSTFRVVIDYDYTTYTPSSIKNVYEQFAVLRNIPRSPYEYRISIVIDNDPRVAKALTKGLLDEVTGFGDLLDRLFRGGLIYIEAQTLNHTRQTDPIANDDWITIHYSFGKAVEWCITNSRWS